MVYGYWRKSKNSHPSTFQLVYGVVPRMNGDEPFPISNNPISLLLQKLELKADLSKRASKSKHGNAVKSQEMTPESVVWSWRQSIGSGRKGSRLNKDGWPSIEIVGLCHVFAAKHLWYQLITTIANVSRQPIFAQRLCKCFCLSAHLLH